MELTALFVTVNNAQFTHADRQVFIAVRGKFVHEHAAGAVHRFDRAVLSVDLGRVHVFLIMIPMA